jgi:hypothetical protein
MPGSTNKSCWGRRRGWEQRERPECGPGAGTVLDGPFAETKEQLAGFYLVDAADLNEAIRIASAIPPAKYGSIEVRPVRELQA